MSTSKSFNKLVKGEPVCIKIDTKYPVTKQTEQACIKSFFSETICENKVQVTDVAFQTTSTLIHKADGKVELKMQQSIFVCFDQWISGSDRSGSDRSGSDRSGSDRSGSDRSVNDRSGSDRSVNDRSGSDRSDVRSDRSVNDRSVNDRSGSDRSGSDGSGSAVSYTSFMNEMTECFAHGGLLMGDTFLCDIADFDTSDWVITYFDSIRHIDEIL